LNEASYIEEFVHNYGEWNRSLAAQLWRVRAASGADTRYFAFPMLRRVAERSRAVVVHNPEAARMVLAEAPGVRVVEIPHLFAPAPGPGEAEALRYRQRLGVPAGAFLFGVFGYLRESKRLETILRVFSDVRRSHGEACLLVAGDFVSTDLERAVAPILKDPGVIRRPFLQEREFGLAAAAVDACINLKSPSAGETSGIAVRMMGLGKPVLATDGPEISRIPEDAVLRIPSGVPERESLLVHMRLLISVNDAAGAIGRRASAYISELHSVDRAARQYWKLLCDCCA
jgi:glycosyltransferase involved in cell wall biosynthesis